MIYKFKSKPTGDLVMTGPVGDQVLRLIGKAPAERGIIEAGAMAAAIGALEAAIAGNGPDAAAGDAPGAGEGSDGGSAAERVSLKQRVWPMLEMMKRAGAEHADIVWGV